MKPRSPEEVGLAIFAHRVTVALDAEAAAAAHREAVEAEAAAAGFHLPAWHRALSLMREDPAAVEALERHTAVVLHAVRAGVQSEIVTVTTINERSAEERRQEIMDDGYYNAVVGRPCSAGGYTAETDRRAFAEGWHAFHLDLAASEARRAVALISGAFSPTPPAATLTAPIAGEAA